MLQTANTLYKLSSIYKHVSHNNITQQFLVTVYYTRQNYLKRDIRETRFSSIENFMKFVCCKFVRFMQINGEKEGSLVPKKNIEHFLSIPKSVPA